MPSLSLSVDIYLAFAASGRNVFIVVSWKLCATFFVPAMTWCTLEEWRTLEGMVYIRSLEKWCILVEKMVYIHNWQQC